METESANFLDKLLDGAAVEWVAVSELFDLKAGYTPSKSNKKFWENGCVPWLRMDDIRQNGRIINDSLQKVSQSAVKGGKLFPANSLVFATSATIGEHALVLVPHLTNQRFTNLALKEKFVSVLMSKFLFYYGFLLADWCKKNTTTSSFASVDMAGFRKFCFPIPCPNDVEKSLAIQGEIVRILDRFTELTTELTTELNARKTQYKYYLNKLFNVEENVVTWRPLGELGELIRGNGLTKKELTEEGVPAIHYGQIYTHYGLTTTETRSFVSSQTASTLKKVKRGDVIITNTSENWEDVGTPLVYLGKRQAVIGGHATIFRPRHVLGMYFAYFTQTDTFQQLKRKYTKGTKVMEVSTTDWAKILIPIFYASDSEKSLAEQQRIVTILDKFDVLTTSLTEGLPREIALRQKQYAYYRDLLLNFPKPDTRVA